MPFKSALIGLALLLAGCNSFPSGAGLESEVLKHGDEVVAGTATATSAGVPAEFAVETVTRDNLARFAHWPAVGEPGLPWIGRVDQPNDRIVSPGDTVELTIWNTEGNSLLTAPGQRFITLPPMQVSTDGTIFLPYIGETRIGGLSTEGARSAVQTAYATVSPSTQASLALAEGRQSSVSLISGVTKPGVFPLPDQDMTLLEVLAQAGGTEPNFVNPQVRLQRGNRTYGISMARLLADAALNTTLVGGDRVYVEEDKRYFLSLGAASKETQVHFPRDHVSALDAVSLIGGLTDDRANAGGILILRRFPDSAVRRDGSGPRHVRTIFTVDLTSADGLFSAGQFQINAGDLIYITEAPMIDTARTLGLIGVAFGLGNSAQDLSK
jgi:polysaccharide biosynthesis/export protein